MVSFVSLCDVKRSSCPSESKWLRRAAISVLFSSRFSKRRGGLRFGARSAIGAWFSSWNIHIESNDPAAKMTFAREKVARGDIEDVREKLDLPIGRRTAPRFDVRENIASHVAPKQL